VTDRAQCVLRMPEWLVDYVLNNGGGWSSSLASGELKGQSASRTCFVNRGPMRLRFWAICSCPLEPLGTMHDAP